MGAAIQAVVEPLKEAVDEAHDMLPDFSAELVVRIGLAQSEFFYDDADAHTQRDSVTGLLQNSLVH